MKRPGFTLMELIVSLGIFGILTVLITANLHRGRLIDDLRVGSQQLEGAFRRMQNLATVGQPLADGSVPPGGYGIFIPVEPGEETTRFEMFGDTALYSPSNGCLPTTATNADFIYYDGCDTLVEGQVVNFRSGVVIDCFKADTVVYSIPNTGRAGVNVTFQPPRPTPIVTYSTVGTGTATRYKTLQVELWHKTANVTRVVTINGASGQISEEVGHIDTSGGTTHCPSHP